jgi:G3E family GTPase
VRELEKAALAAQVLWWRRDAELVRLKEFYQVSKAVAPKVFYQVSKAVAPKVFYQVSEAKGMARQGLVVVVGRSF